MTEGAQNADFRRKPPLLLEIQACGGRRKPQIFAGNCRKPQIGLRHLRCVTFSLALLYRALRLRFGYGFESGDANGPRNVKTETLRNKAPSILPLLLVDSQESVLKAPPRQQFHAAIHVTPKRCDSCAQGALGRQTVSRRNFCNSESLAKQPSNYNQGFQDLPSASFSSNR